jgi:hypothetical protein
MPPRIEKENQLMKGFGKLAKTLHFSFGVRDWRGKGGFGELLA